MSGPRGETVSLGFETTMVIVPIAALIPVKTLRATIEASRKYAQIAQSIREIGLVKPPVVARDPAAPGRYLLLDGHLRVEVLNDAGGTEVIPPNLGLSITITFGRARRFQVASVAVGANSRRRAILQNVRAEGEFRCCRERHRFGWNGPRKARPGSSANSPPSTRARPVA